MINKDYHFFDPYLVDVTNLNIEALCLDRCDTYRGDYHEELVVGQRYKVTHIRMTLDFTYVYLEGYDTDCNSISFEFYIGDNPHCIYDDERCYSEALKRRHAILMKMAEARKDSK